MASLVERAGAHADAEAPAGRRRWGLPRLPLAMWACMALAVANAFVWSLITPSFQIPDEPVQAGYVQYLAETGKLPKPISIFFNGSPEEDAALDGVPFSLTGQPTWSTTRNHELTQRLAQPLGKTSPGAAGYAASAPPLYFALEAIPYELASSGNFFNRLYAMRFFSALLAGLTVGFVFLFLRELMPRTRYAWTVGALAVALQPVFGFIGGGVNYDNLLWAVSAALLWLLARAFRRGLTPRLGAAIGATIAAGVLTKGSILGLVPGVALALVALVLRSPARRRAALGAFAAVGAAAIPVAAWLVASSVAGGRSAATATGAGLAGVHTTLGGELDYLWQFYLPHLPFMQHQWFWSTRYPHYPLWQTYVQGLIGRFGWFDVDLPGWAYWVGLGVLVVIGALAATGLVRARRLLARRRGELVAYVVMALGLALLVNAAGYRYRLQTGDNFEQTRYLFPLLGLYGAVIALAARGVGRRWAPAAGAVLVVLAFAQDVFAQLATVAHYYG